MFLYVPALHGCIIVFQQLHDRGRIGFSLRNYQQLTKQRKGGNHQLYFWLHSSGFDLVKKYFFSSHDTQFVKTG
jgi:hypothetical protein